jgi:hypothetical protein
MNNRLMTLYSEPKIPQKSLLFNPYGLEGRQRQSCLILPSLKSLPDSVAKSNSWFGDLFEPGVAMRIGLPLLLCVTEIGYIQSGITLHL